jgi:hypothetical protein
VLHHQGYSPTFSSKFIIFWLGKERVKAISNNYIKFEHSANRHVGQLRFSPNWSSANRNTPKYREKDQLVEMDRKECVRVKVYFGFLAAIQLYGPSAF